MKVSIKQKATMVMLIIMFAVVSAAQTGQSTYTTTFMQVNGVAVNDLPKGKLTLFSGGNYLWTDEKGTSTKGTFTYNLKDQQFTFTGPLSTWGSSKLDKDTKLWFSFSRNGQSFLVLMRRVPGRTLCPVFPIC